LKLISVIRSLRDRISSPTALWPLAAGRISFGSLLFFTYLNFSFAEQELFPFASTTQAEVKYRNFFPFFEIIVPNLSAILNVGALRSLLLLVALAFTLGWRIRVTGVLLFFLHLFFYSINPVAFSKWSLTVAPGILVLAFSSAGKMWSIESWRCQETYSFAHTPATRFLQMHLCSQYLTCSLPRLSNDLWLSGLQVYAFLNSSLFGRFPGMDSPRLAQLSIPLTYSVLLLELFAPILLIWQRTRTFGVFALAFLHFGLLAFTTLPGWQLFCLTSLLFFFGEQHYSSDRRTKWFVSRSFL
jgi:hypothetical protein